MPKRHLRVWIMPMHVGTRTRRTLQHTLEGFLTAHPEIEVDFRILPWSGAWHELMHAFKTGEPPDVFQVGSTWMATMAHLGFLAEMPDWIEPRPAMAPWIDRAARPGGRRLGLPWLAECSALIARSDVLEGIGLSPADLGDWDGFLAACREIGRRADRHGGDPGRPLPIGITCRPEAVTLHNTSSWLWSGGWSFPEQLSDNVRLLGSDDAVPGLLYLGQLLQAGESGEEDAEIQPYRLTQDFYEQGRFAFLKAHWWLAVRRAVGNPEPSFDRWPIDLLPVPRGPAGFIPRGGASLMAVSPRSPHRDEAWALARHFVSDHFLSEWARESGEVPATLCSFWEDHAAHPTIATIRRTIESSRSYPLHPMWVSLESALANGLSDILWGFLAGKGFESHGRQAARRVDDRISMLLRLAWDIPDPWGEA